jgi:hypothetical protein
MKWVKPIEMKIRFNIFIICLGLVLITSCEKDVSQEFVAYNNNPLNDTVWATVLKDADPCNTMIGDLTPAVVEATIDLSENRVDCKPGNTDSLKITFNKDIFTSLENGVVTPVAPTGTAVVQVLRIRTSGDLIRMLRPTQTGHTLTEFGTGLFIRVMKDGKELSIKSGKNYQINLIETGAAPKVNMQRYLGSESIPAPAHNVYDPNFTWKLDTDVSYLNYFWENSRPVGYALTVNKLRWVTAQRPTATSSPNSRSRVTVYFSPSFTNKNTNVYAVFVGQKSVVKLDFDYASRSFRTDLLPYGFAYRLVSISKIGNNFYLGDASIANLTTPSVLKLNPQKVNEQKLHAYLDDL